MQELVIKRIFITALAAGLLAGVFASLIQTVTTTPLILQAETYEHAPAPSEEPGAPSEAFERFLSTLLANAVTAAGFQAIFMAECPIKAAPGSVPFP
ncbi:MAG TPA: hypothetical protein ENI79_02040 [Rhodospirillales bacterium]|nr:hypothetical protein [Rhodospirillales bacterium]